jgi:uncharacterized protein YqhQ
MEGVMMRAPSQWAVACRRPDGSIITQQNELPLSGKSALRKVPFLRGILVLVESLSLGFRALSWSAIQSGDEEEGELSRPQVIGTMVLAVVVAIALFILLPAFAADYLKGFFNEASLAFVIFDGIIRIALIVLYIWAISRSKEIRRVFQYHGAEHKTIHAYEKNLPLTVENVQTQTTLHPRCGTTFLVVVIVVSIILGSLVAPLLMPDVEGWVGQVSLLIIRIGLLPIIAAISYELQKLSARFCTTGWRRVVLYPGFLFQKITTREPDDDQVEIAIAAMEAAAWREQVRERAPHGEDPIVFASFARFREVLSGEGSLGASRAA